MIKIVLIFIFPIFIFSQNYNLQFLQNGSDCIESCGGPGFDNLDCLENCNLMGRVELTPSIDIAESQSYSIGMWINIDGSSLDPGSGQYVLYNLFMIHPGYDSGSIRMMGCGYTTYSIEQVSYNMDHHIVITRCGLYTKIYLDGNQVSFSSGESLLGCDGSYSIGFIGGTPNLSPTDLQNAEQFWGSIDDLFFYDTCLSEVEIQELYNNPCESYSLDNLIEFFDFNEDLASDYITGLNGTIGNLNGDIGFSTSPFCNLEEQITEECEYDEIEGFNYGGYFQGSHYYISEEESTWTEANDNINALGIGHFVAISSQEENDFITSIASLLPPNTTMEGTSTNWPGAQVWIGLFSNIESGYTGIYEWVNGEELIYDNWYNMGPSGDPAGILISYDGWNGYDAGVWNDGLIDSGTTAFSILELPCNDDMDGDGIVDSEDDDIDGDGILNIDDSDMDGDGIMNSEDEDMDGDAILDNEDNFFPIGTFIQDCSDQITPSDTNGIINMEDLFFILDNWLEIWPQENE